MGNAGAGCLVTGRCFSEGRICAVPHGASGYAKFAYAAFFGIELYAHFRALHSQSLGRTDSSACAAMDTVFLVALYFLIRILYYNAAVFEKLHAFFEIFFASG